VITTVERFAEVGIEDCHHVIYREHVGDPAIPRSHMRGSMKQVRAIAMGPSGQFELLPRDSPSSPQSVWDHGTKHKGTTHRREVHILPAVKEDLDILSPRESLNQSEDRILHIGISSGLHQRSINGNSHGFLG